MTSLGTRQGISWMWATAVLALMAGTTVEAGAGETFYATADNGTTNLFGTLNLATGQFTEIATTTPFFGSLTAGTDGTLYGSAADSNLYTISPTGTTARFGSFSAPESNVFSGFLGIASQGGTGFFADSVTSSSPTGPFTPTLFSMSADNNNASIAGPMGSSFGSYNSGNLAFGPNGNLYFDAWNTTASDIATLYLVNITTGMTTAVGSGLGSTDPLALAASGSTLYGIDTFATTDPSIYSINTATGVATDIGTVTGLPNGYTLDTIAFASSVPEPSTSILMITGAVRVGPVPAPPIIKSECVP